MMLSMSAVISVRVRREVKETLEGVELISAKR
jgi:hypothetical protein